MTKDEWQVLFDNVFSNEPGYLIHVAVAYLIVCRNPLLSITESEDFEYFFHHRNAANIRAVIREANRLVDITPDSVNPGMYLIRDAILLDKKNLKFRHKLSLKLA